MRQKKLAVVAGLLVCSTLVLGSLAAVADVPTPPPPPAPVASASTPAPAVTAGSLPELTTLIKQNSAAVVNVSMEGKSGGAADDDLPEGLPPELKRFFRGLPDMQEHDTRAMGSGFVVSPDGYIITNAHVVDGAKSVTVGLSDKRELPAEIIGVDKLSDIALLKIKADNLPVVQLGDSDKLEVGQWVVALGAPFGLDHSATQGIVSALSRSLPDGTYVPFIQTDVAVNPGNSGGPLFDLGGRVVGVNSQIYSRSGGYMGISFAIPVNVVKNVIEQLKTNGQVSRGWLGVEIQDMDQGLASSFNLAQPEGALVAGVQPNSPAEKAGIQTGDIIVGFGDGKVTSASDLPLLVGNTPIGSQVPIKIRRSGVEKTLDVTIAKLDNKDQEGPKAASDQKEKGMLGLAVSTLSADELKERKLDNGVLVQEVLADSPAEKAGLEAGDVIVSVNSQAIKSPADLKTAVQSAPEGRPLAMLVMQGERMRFLAVTK
ncbi:DegQ family serine endoprotease [Candidatus Thiothrix sp. Deng01]|uniref:Probable periplasmic serine endoprotease DegP-like n=1 Tax=Candidatus Thiothrix phosphatis TaxID=3112415 RepID=A0ABU6D3S2_9GAMM|nr:DegQ family serine endoprotease [Candidatus Thiothrix sp. Deng01]MEB4592969.1 DegQ family serine endoprotease [Candidatus Thiothrix sp. Deng01]